MVSKSGLKISFCTTCHGRLWQLEKTLFANLERLGPNDEFVLLNYGSPDGLDSFVKESAQCQNAIASGRLLYVFINALKFHAAKAKNLSHRIARGTILVNLDADNENVGMSEVIHEVFESGSDNIVLHMDDERRNGAFGRVCLNATWFFLLGGYDESFMPMAYQDIDLIERAKASGLQYVLKKSSDVPPIQNTVEQKLEFTGYTDWKLMRLENKRRSESNLKAGKVIANCDGWGGGVIKINFGKSLTLPPIVPCLVRYDEGGWNFTEDSKDF